MVYDKFLIGIIIIFALASTVIVVKSLTINFIIDNNLQLSTPVVWTLEPSPILPYYYNKITSVNNPLGNIPVRVTIANSQGTIVFNQTYYDSQGNIQLKTYYEIQYGDSVNITVLTTGSYQNFISPYR